MHRRLQIALLAVTFIGATGIGAQQDRTPSNPWLLESYRPVVGVQFCDPPHILSLEAFDGTPEECKAEFDRLFVKCTTELPNVKLPAKFRTKGEQGAAITLLYECMASHYIGGDTLDEFNRRYPPAPPADTESGD